MHDTVRTTTAFGEQLRQWRQHRRLSQLALALEAGISTRHLSFVETGRSQPSRELVLRLAHRLEVPLRDRNAMLMAAGYAPMYPQRALDDPELAVARDAVVRVLAGHEPHPALAVDRHWNMVLANRMVAPLLAGVAPALLAGTVNVLRLSLHPQGLAPRILNLAQWRAHLFDRLRQQIAVTADAGLRELLGELEALAGGRVHAPDRGAGPSAAAPGAVAGATCASLPGAGAPQSALAVPLRLASPLGELALISTTTIFGTPVDVTLAELAIESFFPADGATAARLRSLHARIDREDADGGMNGDESRGVDARGGPDGRLRGGG